MNGTSGAARTIRLIRDWERAGRHAGCDGPSRADRDVIVILDEEHQIGHIGVVTGRVGRVDTMRILTIVAEHFETLMETWSTYHR
jgi:hypothetical protein